MLARLDKVGNGQEDFLQKIHFARQGSMGRHANKFAQYLLVLSLAGKPSNATGATYRALESRKLVVTLGRSAQTAG